MLVKPKYIAYGIFFFSVEDSLSTFSQSVLILSMCISFGVYKRDAVYATTAGC